MKFHYHPIDLPVRLPSRCGRVTVALGLVATTALALVLDEVLAAIQVREIITENLHVRERASSEVMIVAESVDTIVLPQAIELGSSQSLELLLEQLAAIESDLAVSPVDGRLNNLLLEEMFSAVVDDPAIDQRAAGVAIAVAQDGSRPADSSEATTTPDGGSSNTWIYITLGVLGGLGAVAGLVFGLSGSDSDEGGSGGVGLEPVIVATENPDSEVEIYQEYNEIFWPKFMAGNIKLRELDDNADGLVDKSYIYDYDTEGTQIQEDIYIFRYDEVGTLIREEHDEYGDGVVDETYTYNYDERGNLTLAWWDDGNNGVFDEIYAYTYDEEDNLILAEWDYDADEVADEVYNLRV